MLCARLSEIMGHEGLDAHGPSAAPVADARTSTTLGTTSWQSCPQAHGKSYGTAAEPMRTEHVRSSLAPAGLTVQTSTFNALDSSDVGNVPTNLSAKTRTRLLWATRHTGGVYHHPSLQSHSGAKETRVLEFPFSGWPCGDQGRQRRIDNCHDGAAASLIASSGLRILRDGYLTIGKDARIVMEGRGRVRAKSSRL